MVNHEINYKEKNIKYSIQWKDVKNINLRVKPNLEVLVSAPKKVKEKDVIAFVKDKNRWIYKNIKKFEKTRSIKNPSYISGESFRYLGKQYMLKVFESPENRVKYYRGRIFMYVEDKSDFKLKEKIYSEWLKYRSQIIFKEILDKMYEKIKVYGVEYPKMTIRKMKTRWGSCKIDKGKININLYLIKAPKTSIEYVILHELVHFLYADHSKKFYSLLGTLMPDYEKRKKVLDEDVVRYL